MQLLLNLYRFKSYSQKKYLDAKEHFADAKNYLEKKNDAFKTIPARTVIETTNKIKDFSIKYYKPALFTISLIFAFGYAPMRFLTASALTLIVQKIDFEKDEKAISINNFSLSILGAIGIILEISFCPVCDPSFYLAPMMSGAAFSKACFNLYQNYFSKES